MNETLSKAYAYALPYAISFIAAILIFVIGKWVARLATRLLEQAMVAAKVDKTLASFAKNIVYYVILVFVAIAALGKLGIQTNSFIAMIGAAGLAVGLALQGSLANFAAGVMMILFAPFKVDDTVEVGGVTGKVKEIQIFSTILVTPDNKKVIMPNAKITSDKIIVLPK